MPENTGRVIQISGPAVDLQFSLATLPPIYQAVRIVSDGFQVPEPISIIVEVQQHLGDGRVRFASKFMDQLIWSYLATRAGREVVGDW